MSNMKTSFDKFARSEWNKIERKYDSPIINTVLDVIYDLGYDYSEKNIYTKSDLITSGDEVYVELRKKLVKEDILPIKKIELKTSKKKGKKNKKKKGPTRDEIRRQNKMKKTLKSFENTLNMIYSNNKLNNTYGFRSNYAEVRLVTLICTAKYFVDNNISEEDIYELIIGIAKTLCNIHTLKGISEVAVLDLIYILNSLKTKVNFKYEIMCQRYPKLCISTKYDIVFPTMAINPYDSQKQLMKIVLDNNCGFIIYKSMIGSGKTTLSVAVSRYCEKIRDIQRANSTIPTLQVLFACSVEPVRLDVCRMAYNKNIPFGIGVTIDEKIRIINNFNCKSKEERILIVADLNTTLRLLKDSNNYILFLDEPTVGADQEDHPITRTVADILLNCPKCTILSSATMPELSEITTITNNYLSRYSDSDIHMVYSRESMIGCQVIDYYGNIIVPFANCKTCDNLRHIIKQIKTKPFVGRLLPAPILYKLNKTIFQLYPEYSVDIDKCFEDIGKLSQNEIQKIILRLLDTLADTDDNEIIENIFQNFAGKRDNLEYDMTKIFTTDAYKFAGPCLVTTKDPYKFVVDNTKTLLEDIPISEIITEYTTSLDKYKSSVEKVNLIKNVEEKERRLSNLNKIKNRLLINFPKERRVNTKFHLQKYAPQVDKSTIHVQPIMVIESLPTDLDIPDIVMSALYAGIGIYHPSNKLLGKRYHELVLELASEGLLAFLVSDDSISYGANYPFSHVTIDKTISDEHSINSIFQLAGRAGRVGESWAAFVHVDDFVRDRIVNYIEGNEDTGSSEEGINMTNAFIKLLKEEKYKEDKKSGLLADKPTNNEIKVLVPGIVKMSSIKEPVKDNALKKTDNAYVPPNRRNSEKYNDRSRKSKERYNPPNTQTSGKNRGYNGEPNGNADKATNWRKKGNYRRNRK